MHPRPAYSCLPTSCGEAVQGQLRCTLEFGDVFIQNVEQRIKFNGSVEGLAINTTNLNWKIESQEAHPLQCKRKKILEVVVKLRLECSFAVAHCVKCNLVIKAPPNILIAPCMRKPCL